MEDMRFEIRPNEKTRVELEPLPTISCEFHIATADGAAAVFECALRAGRRDQQAHSRS